MNKLNPKNKTRSEIVTITGEIDEIENRNTTEKTIIKS